MYYQIDHLHGQASAAVEKLQINFEQIRRHYLRNAHAFWQRNLKTDKSEGKVVQKEAVSTPKEASRGPVDLGQL
jgi:hypothetical protein